MISEITQVCDRLLLIHEGALLADGPLDTLCRNEGIAGIDIETLFLKLVGRCEHGGDNGGGTAGAREAGPAAAPARQEDREADGAG